MNEVNLSLPVDQVSCLVCMLVEHLPGIQSVVGTTFESYPGQSVLSLKAQGVYLCLAFFLMYTYYLIDPGLASS